MMGIVDRPFAGHQDMHRDKPPCGCLACAQGMKVHSLLSIFFHDILYQRLFLSRQSCIHQTGNRPDYQTDPCPDDVESYNDRNHWVEDVPACNACNGNAADYTCRSPHISHEMVRVRLKGDRMACSSFAQ